MDLFVCLTGIGAFFLFFVVHIVVFRQIASAAIMRWLVRCVLFVAMIDAIFVWWWSQSQQISPVLTIVGGSVSLFLYMSAVYVYVNVILGLATTSIRMHMLLTIAEKGKKGMDLSDMLLLYNRDKIVLTRISRLVASKEIFLRGEQYSLSKRLTPFRVFGMVHLFICSLYGVKRRGEMPRVERERKKVEVSGRLKQ